MDNFESPIVYRYNIEGTTNHVVLKFNALQGLQLATKVKNRVYTFLNYYGIEEGIQNISKDNERKSFFLLSEIFEV